MPPSSPPPYRLGESSPFREPELISDEPMSDEDEHMPALISQDVIRPQQQSAWYAGATHWDAGNNQTWVDQTTSWSGGKSWENEVGDQSWAGTYNHGDWGFSKKVPIDGTDDEEEKNWWNPIVREKHKRPGPGVLAPILEELLHNVEHTLFYVKVTPPDLARHDSAPGSSAGSSPSTSIDRSYSSQSMNASPQSSSSLSSSSPPSAEDLINAVPHPNAFYCRKHNGWVILLWKNSTVLPPLAKSFKEDPQHPLPDLSRRKKVQSCLNGEPSYGQGNKTHHFHVYEKAVSAHKLTPPFYRRPWERADKVKQKRRRMTTLNMDDLDVHISGDNRMDEDTDSDEEGEGDLLDLYVCCQCSLHCVASDVIPGVISPKHVEEFTRLRLESPGVGKNGEESVVLGWETFLTYVWLSLFVYTCLLICVTSVLENKLWKGENRILPIGRRGFQKKMGWNSSVCVISA